MTVSRRIPSRSCSSPRPARAHSAWRRGARALATLATLATLAALAAAAGAGCASNDGYALVASFPHKDALDLVVFIDGRRDASEYQAIARREIDRLCEMRRPGELPLYEVRVDFCDRGAPHTRRASLRVRLDTAVARLSGHRAEKEKSCWEVFLY